jgi:hypothetical protein
MATITSVSDFTGDFSDPNAWVGGVVPGAGDTAVLFRAILTVDADITCDEIVHSDFFGYGKLIVDSGKTINATVRDETSGFSGADGMIVFSTSETLTINGNFFGTNVTGWHSINGSGTGKVVINGNVRSTQNGGAVRVTGDGFTLEVNGDVYAGSQTPAIFIPTANQTVTIVGDVYGGHEFTPGSFTGNQPAIEIGAADSTISVTGKVESKGPVAIYVFQQGNTEINISGSVKGNVPSGGAPDGGYAVRMIQCSNSFIELTDCDVIDSPDGHQAIEGTIIFFNGGGTTTHYDSDGEPNIRGVAGEVDFPAESDVLDGVAYDEGNLTGTYAPPSAADVRDGTAYGAPENEATGTLAVPPVNRVSAGTPVDDTEGTAVLNIDVVGALFEAFESPEA